MGEAALYLVVAAEELSTLERALLDRLAGARQVSLAGDAPEDWARIAPSAAIFRAVGEENEIREAFRRVFAAGVAWDDVEPNDWNNPDFIKDYEKQAEKALLKPKEHATANLHLGVRPDAQ